MSGYQIFSGSSSFQLSESISEFLGKPLGRISCQANQDGELVIRVIENVSRQEVFLIQSIVSCSEKSVNDNLIELFLMVDAMKRSLASKITIVVPYFGYFAQKKKEAERAPMPARIFASLLERAGINHVITIDCKDKVEELFSIPVSPLFARQVLLDAISERIVRRHVGEEVVIVSSDKKGLELAEGYAKRMNKGLAVVNFRFSQHEQKDKIELLGTVKDKVVVILKDIVNTAVSLCEAAKFLKEQGAKEVHACVVHSVFSGNSVQMLNDSVIESIIVTDTIPLSEEAKKCTKISKESVKKILGEAIIRSFRGDAMDSLY